MFSFTYTLHERSISKIHNRGTFCCQLNDDRFSFLHELCSVNIKNKSVLVTRQRRLWETVQQQQSGNDASVFSVLCVWLWRRFRALSGCLWAFAAHHGLLTWCTSQPHTLKHTQTHTHTHTNTHTLRQRKDAAANRSYVSVESGVAALMRGKRRQRHYRCQPRAPGSECRSARGISYIVRGIVHPRMKIEFLHWNTCGEIQHCISVSAMDALQWMGAVRMRVQSPSVNINAVNKSSIKMFLTKIWVHNP